MKSIKNKHSYLVVDTWNGMGYSTENGVELKQFNKEIDAMAWANKRCMEQVKFCTSLPQGDSIWGLDCGGYCYESDLGGGSYQIVETKDVYAVMIKCNINEVETLTKEKYYNKIQELDGLYGEDLDDCLDVDENGDRFYHSHVDEYDYQFRLVENIKQFVEVYTTDCYECAQEVEYTDILPYCPNCLTNLG